MQVIRVHAKIREIMEAADITGRRLRGRQALHLITESFRTSDNADIHLEIDHLSRLEYSDSRREEFYYEWTRIMSGMHA